MSDDQTFRETLGNAKTMARGIEVHSSVLYFSFTTDTKGAV
jgi:hypothetical protein